MLTNTTEQAKKVADAVDAIILTGGGVDPTGRRDKFEKEIISNIVKQKKPVFAICRGLQMINDIFGGDIVNLNDAYPNHLQHKTSDYCMDCKKTQHKVLLQENSLINKILNKKIIRVNTNHSYGIKKIGKNIVVSGFAEDGVPESIEMKSYPTFFLGVQWHPEFLATKDDEKIVKAFCDSVVDNNN
jgi:putative glutamine amidotransferase